MQQMLRRTRRRVLITGIVQGVGFRPFVYSLATHRGLSGFVANDTTGVLMEVEGDPIEIAQFIEDLQAGAPPLAVLDNIQWRTAACTGEAGFAIIPSRHSSRELQTLVSPDIAPVPIVSARCSTPLTGATFIPSSTAPTAVLDLRLSATFPTIAR
jgi:hydrogenase maturation protein HypF